MFSQFFIQRPKFAFVIAIVITLAGLLSLLTLPVNMYPEITPPQVRISAVFPGASATVVEESVIRPIEEQVNGVEGMLSIESTATNNGTATITITFSSDTDADLAQVNTQNRVAIAEPKLPEEARRQGITVTKQSGSSLLGITLYSPDNSLDELFLGNYAANYITEPLARISGVASVSVLGSRTYSMRIWLDPKRMAALELTVGDIRSALQEQNVIVAAGKLGQPPNTAQEQFEYTIQTQGRLTDVDDFGDTIIRSRTDGNFIRLRDIARIELGSQDYAINARRNNDSTAYIEVYQLSDANATEVAARVKERLAELSERFPQGLEYSILYDTTKFIERSIAEVKTTLYQAVGLVILVVFLFLQNWRATLIPAIAIPVSLVGTFAFMGLMGFTINTITLFGLVLAIGVVVDDAIVVIENVERLMKEEGLSSVEATRKAMQQVAGPIIATTLVLLAVFVPVGFMPGITGELYKQFSVTISVAVLISSLNALTLSPALCATLLKADAMEPIRWLRPVELGLSKLTEKYQGTIGWILKRSLRVGSLVLVLFLATGWLAKTVPTGFIPAEDQGYIFVNVQLPDAASLNRTQVVMDKVSDIARQQPGITDMVSIAGFGILGGQASNNGLGIVVLDDWDNRTEDSLQIDNIISQLQARFWALPDAQIMVFNMPPIPGMGNSSGFDFRLQDSEGRAPQDMAQVLNGLIYQANQQESLTRVFSTYRANVPQYYLEVDRNKAKAMGIDLSEIFMSLQAQLGSLYINDFNKFGRTYQVIMQSENNYRRKPEDLQHFYIRNKDNEMVPLTTLATLSPVQGPTSINHFNLYRAATINGEASPGFSSGDALAAMEALAQQLPQGYTFEWSGQSAQEKAAGNLAPLLFGLAIIFVYLFLVAQYESWAIPFSVLGAVPIAIFGAMASLWVGGMVNNIYAQVGLVLLIGLSAKTAILIVEFAMEERRAGRSVFEAAFNAAHLRFRAVLMTALSFVLGVLPLVFSSGAGAASRVSIGVTVLGGMLAATVFGTLLIPLFYQLVQQLREKIKGQSPT
jgi:multidrug efflux pump